MTRARALARNVVLATLVSACTLLMAELALRLLYPRSGSYFVIAPGERRVNHPGSDVQGISGPATYETNALGVRGPELGPEGTEHRILAIGGSTTQNPYLDVGETWTLLLHDLLGPTGDGRRTWSGDVGRSGNTLRSHFLQLRHFAPQVPELGLVVMMVGFNDLSAALRSGFEYRAPPPLSDQDALASQMAQAFVQVPGRLHDRLTVYHGAEVSPVKRTALYQLARQARNAIVAARGGEALDEGGAVFATWRRHRAEATLVHDSLPDLHEALGVFRAQLEDVVAEARGQGVRLLLVTHPVLWRADLSAEEEARLWFGGIGDFQEEPGHEYFSSAALRSGMDAYNREILDVCRRAGAECLDLASMIPSDTTVFFDDVHFTEHGSRLAAEFMADYLRTTRPYGQASAGSR